MSNLQQQAQEWREKWNAEIGALGKYGVVIFFDGKAESWMNELRNPESLEPGCIAVDSEGNQWKATGGDSYNGAKEWIALNVDTWESIQHCYVSFKEHYKGFTFTGTTESGAEIVAEVFDDDGRLRVTRDPVQLHTLEPYKVTVAGVPVQL